MATTTPVSLHRHFTNLSDPRVERARRHELLDIIAITVRAIISGAEAWTAIEEYGLAKQNWLARFLRLSNGIPRMTPSLLIRSCQALPRTLVVTAG